MSGTPNSTPSARRTLIAAVGGEDPYRMGLLAGLELAGPVLLLAQEGEFERVVLLATPVMGQRARDTAAELAGRVPGVDVQILSIDVGDEADYLELLTSLRRVLAPFAGAGEMSASLASGSPELRACLMFLAASGQMRARLLDVELPSHPAHSAPCIKEIPVEPEPDSTGRVVKEPGAVYSIGGSARPERQESQEDRLDRAARKLGIRGDHPALQDMLRTAAMLAEHRVPVLIEGETGTGKTLIARLIHELSGRPAHLFVQINCGALPEKLVESTLFGHRKGAFTGASEDQPGKFELADGGTLFLDEIGELPMELQPKFLKVLEDGIVEPVGARKGKNIDVRIVAATNRDLKAAVDEKMFREDLYYRLSFGVIHMPSLRDRRSDIPAIALHILAGVNKTLRHPKKLSRDALARLESQPWRGNVRDLENVIGRSVLLAQQDVLEADDLLIDEPRRGKDPLAMLPVPHEHFSLEDFLASARKQLILKALELAGGSQTSAARLLGISPQAVHKFLKSTSPLPSDELNAG
jgi:DNA-binding NtrC family response regulator